jgi:hypothetical protein
MKLIENKQLRTVGTNWCQFQLTILPWVGAGVDESWPSW